MTKRHDDSTNLEPKSILTAYSVNLKPFASHFRLLVEKGNTQRLHVHDSSRPRDRQAEYSRTCVGRDDVVKVKRRPESHVLDLQPVCDLLSQAQEAILDDRMNASRTGRDFHLLLFARRLSHALEHGCSLNLTNIGQ